MTLFELAVVVTIAVILVVIAVFSIQTIMVRTKVSRVQQDHRALSRAIQNYIMDYSTVPSVRQGFAPLTHPTAYLGAIPQDPFQRERHPYFYLNLSAEQVATVVISPGPDGDLDLPPELYAFLSGVQQRQPAAAASLAILPEAMTVGNPARKAEPAIFDEKQAAIFATYLRLGRYDPEKGGDGDIITVVHY